MFVIAVALLALSRACPEIEGADEDTIAVNRDIKEFYEISDEYLGVYYIPEATARRLKEDRATIESLVSNIRSPLDETQLEELSAVLAAAGESLAQADKELNRRRYLRRVSVAAPAVLILALDGMKDAIFSTGLPEHIFGGLCLAATFLSIPACNRLLVAVDESFHK